MYQTAVNVNCHVVIREYYQIIGTNFDVIVFYDVDNFVYYSPYLDTVVQYAALSFFDRYSLRMFSVYQSVQDKSLLSTFLRETAFT